jgi:hypothetical protein
MLNERRRNTLVPISPFPTTYAKTAHLIAFYARQVAHGAAFYANGKQLISQLKLHLGAMTAG